MIFSANHDRFIPMYALPFVPSSGQPVHSALRWMRLAGAVGASAALGGWLADHRRDHQPAAVAQAATMSAASEPAPSRRALISGPFEARVTRIIDGDTFEARIPIWFGQEKTVLVRLRFADAPELRSRCAREQQLAMDSRSALAEFLPPGRAILTALSVDKYAGRVVADAAVTLDGEIVPLAQAMIAGGYARPYQGGKRQSWC